MKVPTQKKSVDCRSTDVSTVGNCNEHIHIPHPAVDMGTAVRIAAAAVVGTEMDMSSSPAVKTDILVEEAHRAAIRTHFAAAAAATESGNTAVGVKHWAGAIATVVAGTRAAGTRWVEAVVRALRRSQLIVVVYNSVDWMFVLKDRMVAARCQALTARRGRALLMSPATAARTCSWSQRGSS